MNKHECPYCGLVYDETVGIKECNMAPTPWVLIPDSWLCPLCEEAQKNEFIEIN